MHFNIVIYLFYLFTSLPFTKRLNLCLHRVLSRNRTEVCPGMSAPPYMVPRRSQSRCCIALGCICNSYLADSCVTKSKSYLPLQRALHIPCNRDGEPGAVSWLLPLLLQSMGTCAAPRFVISLATLSISGGGSQSGVTRVSAKWLAGCHCLSRGVKPLGRL